MSIIIKKAVQSNYRIILLSEKGSNSKLTCKKKERERDREIYKAVPSSLTVIITSGAGVKADTAQVRKHTPACHSPSTVPCCPGEGCLA